MKKKNNNYVFKKIYSFSKVTNSSLFQPRKCPCGKCAQCDNELILSLVIIYQRIII